MAKMTLRQIFQKLNRKVDCDEEVMGISDDSRQVQKKWIYICRCNDSKQKQQFKAQALKQQAWVIWEGNDSENVFGVKDIESTFYSILNIYYGNICSDLCMIGVCGTNGKTSTTLLLAQCFHFFKKECMIIGTGFIQYQDQKVETFNTTPSLCILLHYLALAKDLHITHVIMEVSSHAIAQNRIALLRYDYILYTNITSDHLDYHKLLLHYQFSKFALCNYIKDNGIIILNYDDPCLKQLCNICTHKIITVGCKTSHLQIKNINLFASGSSFDLENTHYNTHLLALHNVYNISLCLAIFYSQCIEFSLLQEMVNTLQPIVGRLESLAIKNRYIWIDYAHTKSSLQKVLEFANQVKKRHVYCLIGCGGERDVSKRLPMAQIACKFSTHCIFTSDNPRNEPIHEILSDMIIGLDFDNYDIFENRECAIRYIMKISQEHDIIIIAGKGDETYQWMKGHKIFFHDKTMVLSLEGELK